MLPIQRICIDTNVFIYAFEKNDDLAGYIKEMLLSPSKRKGQFFAASELALAELMVRPFKDRNWPLAHTYDDWLESYHQFEVLAVSRPILLLAAALRSNYASLRLPDAIHLATAFNAGCSHFLTFEKRLGPRFIVEEDRDFDPHFSFPRRTEGIDVLSVTEDVIHQIIEAASA